MLTRTPQMFKISRIVFNGSLKMIETVDKAKARNLDGAT